MSKPKVFIFSAIHKDSDTYKVLDDAGCQILFGSASWHTPQGNNEDEMCQMARGANALCGSSIRSCPITAKIMDSAPDLRIVAKCSIGVDDVDVQAATDRGILVTHCPTEANWAGVAEGTVAIMLTLLKKIRERDEDLKQGKWRSPALQGTFVGKRHDGYPGLTIGIIGLGRIARRFADLMAPWRARILAYDPYIEESHFIIHNVQRVDLPTLLKASDVVTLHVVLTEETNQMMGAEEFAGMKQGAILINTARGQVVNEKALAASLQSGHLAAAGLDVFEDEPIPQDSPLFKLGHKVLLSPHMVASNMGGGLKQGVHWANRSVLSALNGEVPDNVYNKEVIPQWLKRFGGNKVQVQ